MKKIIILFSILLFSTTMFAQFHSVRDGSWNNPLTWSLDSTSTAVPDSTNSVVISHRVEVSGRLASIPKCYDLTIDVNGMLVNYSSDWVSGDIAVYNNLINYGKITPGHRMFLTVKGDLFNYGIIRTNSNINGIAVISYGNIINKGSFRVESSSWITSRIDFHGDTPHHIRTYNDSTIYISSINLLDSLGYVIVDSFASISSDINLKNSKIVLPVASVHPNTLELINVKIKQGKIEANGNKIYSKKGTYCFLGTQQSAITNLIIENAILEGSFLSAGKTNDIDSEDHLVIFKGNTIFNGKLAEWYQNSTSDVYYSSINIEGKFINNGELKNTISRLDRDNGLHVFLIDGEFINNGKIHNKYFHFSGNCKFGTVPDSMEAVRFDALDSNTTVTITSGDVFFKNTVSVDFKGGTLNLPPNSKFYATYMWYNKLQNITLNANNSEIYFPHTEENVVITNPKIKYLAGKSNLLLMGNVEIVHGGTLIAYADCFPTVTIEGYLKNYGSVRNHYTYGDLKLEITGNILHDGKRWDNAVTKLIGTIDQTISIPNDSTWTGKVVFDAMLEGTSYQWKKDGSDISGATEREFVLANGITPDKYGVYQCVVGGNNSRTITIGKAIPVTSLTITDVKIDNLDATSTKVTWKTSVPASGFIFYAKEDTSSGFPLEAQETDGFVTEHSLTLTNLTSGSTYYFIIDQNDADRNIVRSGTYSFVAGNVNSSQGTFVERIASIKKLSSLPDEEKSIYIDGSFISKDVAYVVTNHNRLFKTTDGGKTWTNVSPEQNTDFNKVGNTPRVDFLNENIGTVAFSVDDGANGYDYSKVFAYVWCTTDGGATWSQRFDVNQDQILHLQQVTETVVYVSGASKLGVAGYRWFKKIVRDPATGNYTLSNVAALPDSRPHCKSADWLNENIGVAIGGLNVNPFSMGAFKTTNGAASWSSIQGNLPANNYVTYSRSDQTIKIIDENDFALTYANKEDGTYNTKFFRTKDGGKNWKQGNFDLQPFAWPALSFDATGKNGVMVVQHSGTDSSRIFYYTENGGENWTHCVLPEFSQREYLSASAITPDGTIWLSGNNIWRSGDTTLAVEKDVELPSNYALMQNYPNPFNPSTVIEFSLPSSSMVSLKVYNSIGEEVAVLLNREVAAGYHSVNFNASNLSSGIYFYRISAGSFTQTKKMLLLK